MGGGNKVSCEAEERSPGGLAGRVAGGVGKCCVGAGDCVGMGSPNAEERRSRKEAGRPASSGCCGRLAGGWGEGPGAATHNQQVND